MLSATPAASYPKRVLKFKLSYDVLGNTRFAYSPLAEVASSIRLLGAPDLGHVHQRWLREMRAERSSADIDLLRAIAPPGRWAPGFLYAPAASPQTMIDEQLQQLSAMAPADLRTELETIWSGRAMPDPLREVIDAEDIGRLLANAIWDYWQDTIAPFWPRIRAVLEDDVAYRASLVLSGGLFELLSDLHPEVSLRSDLLYINKPRHGDAHYRGAALTLIPSVFVFPGLIVGHEDDGTLSLTYAARGVGRVWEGICSGMSDDEDRLGSLLGRARAAILTMLSVPMSTTQLAHELEQSPGTVSQHLSILRGSGMVTSWRAGRSVLYRQTALGASVTAAATRGPGRDQAVS
jgi:DNA-binding transcriptional ArsR family regulator